jgi:hypothetical protein
MQGIVRCDYSDEDTIEGTVALSVCLQVLFQSGSLNLMHLVIARLQFSMYELD